MKSAERGMRDNPGSLACDFVCMVGSIWRDASLIQGKNTGRMHDTNLPGVSFIKGAGGFQIDIMEL
jgi:hypothetical protein